MSLPILNYHGIETDPHQYHWKEGERVYVLDVRDYQAQIDLIAEKGFETLKLLDLKSAIQSGGELKKIMITFDDGHLSHFDHAAPRLKVRNQTGLFFISAGLVGKKEMMDWGHLRELLAMGMEVGSHGMNHQPLVNMTDKELEVEVIKSKELIEDKLGVSCPSFSIPRGFFQPRILEVAEKAGYDFMFTSRYDLNDSNADLMRLNRIAIKRGDSIKDFERWISGNLGFKLTIEKAKESARSVLPPSFYAFLAHVKQRVKSS